MIDLTAAYRENSRGLTKIESKEARNQRGIPGSPNRAESLIMAFMRVIGQSARSRVALRVPTTWKILVSSRICSLLAQMGHRIFKGVWIIVSRTASGRHGNAIQRAGELGANPANWL